MKNIYFTVGPSQLYPTVEKHILEGLKEDIPSLSHRSEKFRDIYRTTAENLRKLLDIPKTYHIFFTGSSQENMERVIQNCVDKTSFHIVHGIFGSKFYQTAVDYKKNAVKVEAVHGYGCEIAELKIPKTSELIAVTHNETSSGVAISNNEIYCLRERHPDGLIAVDMVSSVPAQEMDFSQIDVGFFSVQKGFGLPAGLAVLVVNDRAIEKAKNIVSKGKSIGSYHSFLNLLQEENLFQTPETPNVFAIYLLGKVIADMQAYGIDKIRQETEEKAALIYDFFDRQKEFTPLVKDKRFRSKTTIVIDVKGKSKEVLKLLAKHGMIVGSGYGKYKDEHIRIANFPAHQISDVKRLIKILKLSEQILSK